MTAIAKKLDAKLKRLSPEKARQVETLVSELLDLVGQPVVAAKPANGRRISRRADPLFADKAVYRGNSPADLAVDHDHYLYDSEA